MTSNTELFEDLAIQADFRSKLYGLLAGIYNTRPDNHFAEGVLNLGQNDLFSLLEESGDLPEEAGDGLGLIRKFVAANQGRKIDELCTELAVERTRLLRGVKPGYSPPPPYESVYVGPQDSPEMQATVSIRRLYAEEGVGLPEEVRDQPDFIGFELDFMRHLCAKEGEAWKSGDVARAAEYLEKEQSFLKEHLALWVPRFCDVMVKEARLDFYRGIALLTKGFILDEAEKVADYLDKARDIIS